MTSSPSQRRPLGWLEWCLLSIAVLALGWCGLDWGEARVYQFLQSRTLEEQLRHQPLTVPIGSPVGRVEIPRLGLSSIIREGDDEDTLRLAVGHIPGTPLPGVTGNVGLAGHRDTFFRSLRRIKPDDEIRVTTAGGIHTYRVVSTRVVKPDDVWVLNATSKPVLTLVTCYPFTYIGAAPDRFIVRAIRLEGPSPQPTLADWRRQ